MSGALRFFPASVQGKLLIAFFSSAWFSVSILIATIVGKCDRYLTGTSP